MTGIQCFFTDSISSQKFYVGIIYSYINILYINILLLYKYYKSTYFNSFKREEQFIKVFRSLNLDPQKKDILSLQFLKKNGIETPPKHILNYF